MESVGAVFTHELLMYQKSNEHEISDTKTTSGIVYYVHILRHAVIIFAAFLFLFFPKC